MNAAATVPAAQADPGSTTRPQPYRLRWAVAAVVLAAAVMDLLDATIVNVAGPLQGGFGALMIPQGFGLMKQVFDDESEMDKALGLFGPATGVPMLAAPILAGALIGANLWGIGCRLVFLINVPIGALTLVLAVRSLPRGASHPEVELDVGGVGIVGLALVAIIYPLIQGRTDGWPAWCFAMLAAGAVLLLLCLHERRRGENPLIEPALLTNRTYLSGIAVALALFGAYGGLLLCISPTGSSVRAGHRSTPG